MTTIMNYHTTKMLTLVTIKVEGANHINNFPSDITVKLEKEHVSICFYNEALL